MTALDIVIYIVEDVFLSDTYYSFHCVSATFSTANKAYLKLFYISIFQINKNREYTNIRQKSKENASWSKS